MMKTRSSAMQRREFDKAARPKANDNGIDPTSFRTEDDVHAARTVLVQQKADIETQLTGLNINIAAATRRKVHGGVGVDGLLEQKRRLVERKNRIEAQLSELKKARIEMHTAEHASFEAAFFFMAKQLLAGPVYDRLVAAAIQRVKSQQEQTDAQPLA